MKFITKNVLMPYQSYTFDAGRPNSIRRMITRVEDHGEIGFMTHSHTAWYIHKSPRLKSAFWNRSAWVLNKRVSNQNIRL